MPLIQVWNYAPVSADLLPGNKTYTTKFAHDIRLACVSTRELKINDGRDILISLQGPADRAESDLGAPAPMLIIVDLLYDKPERTIEVKRKLAVSIGEVARAFAIEDQHVEVFIRTFDPKQEACWFSHD